VAITPDGPWVLTAEHELVLEGSGAG
jgi:hypothetical protein